MMGSFLKIKLVLVLAGGLFLIPSTMAFSKPESAQPVPARKSVPQKLVRIAAVGTSGFGFSQPALRMRDTLNRVLEIVSNENLKQDEAAQRRALHRVIDKRFDYSQMSERVMEGNWAKMTPVERTKFSALFEHLLDQAYTDLVGIHPGSTIHFLSEKVSGELATIETQTQRQGETMTIIYKLKRQGNDWQVYDFMVQGISMIRNYRSQFSKVIDDESLRGLYRRLQKQTS